MGKGNRAVVLGGSMAGMFVARVLSDVFTEVVVVDRDRFDDDRWARRGVPQGRHAHGLLARGYEIVESLFPGFAAELRAAGIPMGDLGSQVRWYFDGRRMYPSHAGLNLIGIERPVLEHHVRQRVRALPTVTILDGHDIVAPWTNEDGTRVRGVRVHHRAEDGATERVIEAELVVDATGRGSRLPAWLRDMGHVAVDEETIRIGLAYTSRQYRLSSDPFDGDMSINVIGTPGSPRGAFLHTLGGGRCMLSLTGMLGDCPPTDEAGLLSFVKSLPVPDVHDIISGAEPITDAGTLQFPASRRRRYERMDRFPRGLLAAGDAVCSFNPVYGQGMAVAALQALTLREHVADGADPDPGGYFRDLSRVLDVPWDISAGGDLAYPDVVGRRTIKTRLANAYMSRFQAAATHDPVLARDFLRVTGLVDPPQTLMRPGSAVRAIGGSRSKAPRGERVQA